MKWIDIIKKEQEKDYYITLRQFLNSEYESKVIYPPRNLIYNALVLTPLESIKVVILGQDPYINGEATGLAFSVPTDYKMPPTMRNILKELKSDLDIDHGTDLTGWCSEGVLLLNTVLTVQAGKSLSHQNKGWETLTDVFIKEINDNCDGLVWWLAGKHAQSKIPMIDSSKHFIITTSHPSPLSATKTKEPFIGSKCFSRVNDYLVSVGKDPVDWSK
jgi:uracil-DNA glycosylase